jgi:hypothetical protein
MPYYEKSMKNGGFLSGGMIFLLVFLLFGCGNQENKNSEDWKKEVLYATECGFDGLACCIDKEPACLYGQVCCPNPADPSKSNCFEDCSCGTAGKFCCPGENPCGENLACHEGFCADCGGLGEVCCLGGSCGQNGACHLGKCVLCGLPGNPCCADDPECAESDDGRFSECRSGLCSYCGSQGHAACLGEPYCQPNNLLNNCVCFSCGGADEPCCGEDAGSGCKSGLECKLGFCSEG